MLFTWNTKNLCIVFRKWHIQSTAGLFISLLAVVAIAAGYEAMREGIRRYEHWVNQQTETAPSKPSPPCLVVGHAYTGLEVAGQRCGVA